MLLLTVGGLATAARAEPLDREDAHSSEMLKTPFDVRLQLGDSQLRILDARGEEDYQKAHIPGAVRVNASAWRDKSLSPGGLHDASFWGEAVGKLGIDGTKQVVVYGDNMTDVARVWWTLKYLGVTHVAILDGGWSAWVAADYPRATASEPAEAVAFQPHFQADRLMEMQDLLQSHADKGLKVIDARSGQEYAGQDQRAKRSGHIPGAVHLEWQDLLDETGRFKKPTQLQKLFAQHGLTPESQIVTHCASGGRASVNAFAFELLGYPKVKNYYCGWQEWSAADETPVEK